MYLHTWREVRTLHLKEARHLLLAYVQSFTLSVTGLAPKGVRLHVPAHQFCASGLLPDTLSPFRNGRETSE